MTDLLLFVLLVCIYAYCDGHKKDKGCSNVMDALKGATKAFIAGCIFGIIVFAVYFFLF